MKWKKNSLECLSAFGTLWTQLKVFWFKRRKLCQGHCDNLKFRVNLLYPCVAKKEKNYLTHTRRRQINVTMQQVNVFKKIFHLTLSLVIAIYFQIAVAIHWGKSSLENKFADIGERKTSVKTLHPEKLRGAAVKWIITIKEKQAQWKIYNRGKLMGAFFRGNCVSSHIVPPLPFRTRRFFLHVHK